MSVSNLRCATGYIEIVERGRQGAKGETGVVEGGLTGEVLTKLSDTDGDFDWEPISGDNTTEDQIPVKKGNALEDSGLYVNGDGNIHTKEKIVAEGGLETTGSTIEIGQSLSIKSSGPQLVALSKATGTHYEVPYQSIDKTGSGNVFVAKSLAEEKVIRHADFSSPLSSPLSFITEALDNVIINALYFMTTGDINNFRLQMISNSTGDVILSFPDKYRYERGEGVNLFGAGEKKVDIFYVDKSSPIRILQGEFFTINISWDTSIGTILGEAITDIPYCSLDRQIFEFKNIALVEDLDPVGFLGYFADEASLRSAVPVGNDGDSAVVISPSNTIWFWDINAAPADWVDTAITAGGDMNKAIYDPTGKADDAFDMDNMAESTLKKVYTNAERIKLQGIEVGAEVNRTNSELKIDYESNPDTNAFTDGEKTKLSGIEAGAEVNRSNAQLKTDYESNLNTNAFTDAEKSAVATNTTKVSFPGWSDNPDHDVMKEPTGFPINDLTSEIDLTTANMSFINGSRTFEIDPTGVDFSVFQNGIKYTFNVAQSVQISDIEGLHFIYFDNGVLLETLTLDHSIIYSKPFVAVLYWNQVDQEVIYIGEERHGLKMDGHTHVRLHEKDGTIYISGLAIEDFNIGDGSSNTDAQFATSSGFIKDEDILITRSALSSVVGMPVFYKLGTTGIWRREFNAGYSVLNTGTGRLAWNEYTGTVWEKNEVPNNNYVLAHVFASNDITYPFISILGQDTYTTLDEARDGALTELTSLVSEGLPFIEFVAIGTVIFQTSDTFTNAVKGAIILTSDGNEYVDWRTYDVSPAGIPPVDLHNGLRGLQGGANGERYHLTEAQYNGLVFGTQYNIWESNAQSSSSSEVFTNKISVSTPSLPAGTYKITWNTGISNASDRSTQARCLLDGADILGVFSDRPGTGGLINSVGSFSTRVLTAGVHTLQLQYRKSEAVGTAIVEQSKIEIHRIA